MNAPTPPYTPGPPMFTPAAASPPPPPPEPSRKSRLPWIIAVAIAVVGIFVVIVMGAAFLADDKSNASPAPAISTADMLPGGDDTTPPELTPTETIPAPVVADEPEPEVTTAPTKPVKPVAAAKLTDRQWKKIAKDPDAYIGKKYVVYGAVTQFDSATGGDTFRADVGAKNMAEIYDYDTNTMMAAVSSGLLDEVVEDDEFRAEVIVMGAESYETTLGGETTVPSLMVTAIKVL